MKNSNPFQVISLVVFIIIAAVAVYVFSTTDRKTSEAARQNAYGLVTIWGTVPDPNGGVGQLLESYSKDMGGGISAKYTYVPPNDLDQKLLEALANGQGPDVLLLPAEWLYRNNLRIYPIPYDPQKGGVSAREFQDTFAQGGEVFMGRDGVMGMPLAVDPLVMYWNRDIFTNAGIAAIPTKWEEFLTLAPKLVQKDRLDIKQSAVALGEFVNVANAKDILSLLFLQVGNSITMTQPNTTILRSAFLEDVGVPEALRFYTDFANPLKTIYTWNRSLPNSPEMFLSDRLGAYFDFASEFPRIKQKNPRLNVDLAAIPQTAGQTKQVTFGKVHGLVVMKSAKNLAGGIFFAKTFTGGKYANGFADLTGLAPIRRDLLSVPQSDAYKAIAYDAALKAKSWIDPDPRKTADIFSQMVDDVTSGKFTPERATEKAANVMNALLSQ